MSSSITRSFAVIGFFVPLLSLTRWGMWTHIEAVTLGWQVMGVASALAWLLLVQAGRAVITLPMVLLFAFALSSALASLLTPFSLRSWFGTPELGEGIFATLALLMQVSLLSALWQDPAERKPLIIAACTSALVLALLHQGGGVLEPLNFADYLGFVGLFLVIALLPECKNNQHLVSVLALGAVLIWCSNSLTASVLYAALVVLGVVFHASRWMEVRVVRALALMGIALAPLLVLVYLYGLADRLNESPEIPPMFASHAEVAQPLDHPILTRALLAKVAVDALIEKPSSVLAGFGWGSFTDALYANPFVVPAVRLFDPAGQPNPSWKQISGDAYHTHHMALEALFSGGVVALLFWLLLPVLMAWQSRNAWLILAWGMFALLASFWFMVPHAWPFFALALAAGGTKLTWDVRKAVPVVVLGALALIYSASVQAEKILQLHQVQWVAHHAKTMPEGFSPSRPLVDSHGNRHLFLLSKMQVQELQTNLTRHDPLWVGWYADVLAGLTAQVDQGTAPLRVQGQEIEMRNALGILLTTSFWNKVRAPEMPVWEERLRLFFPLAPKRGDQLLPYYVWAIHQPDGVERVTSFADRILAMHPDEPVSLWFSGVILMRDPATRSEGEARSARALELGVERMIPVEARHF